jgi:hypothetical protein
LTPAPGRQDHTSSPSAASNARQARRRVHRIPPRVRDVASRPSKWDETARDIQLIWVRPQAIFLKIRIQSGPLARPALVSIRAALGGTTDTTRRALNRRFDPKHITACSTASRMMSSKITYVPSLIIPDEVGSVHAMLLRIQALLLPVKTLVLSGH